MSETIVGVCDEVSERGEWVTFNVNVGSQYPVRLATKVSEIIELGRAASKSREMFVWTFNEVDGNINPKSGKPYKNRYLESVEPASESDAPVAHNAGAPMLPSQKEHVIVRQACLKAAAQVTSRFPIDTDDPALACMKIAQRFETWVFRDVEEVPFD